MIPAPAPAAGPAHLACVTRGGRETERLGELLGQLAAGPAGLRPLVLLLEGPLGSGKTTFVRGLARGLGAAAPVRSPTFALELSYPGRRTLHHLDLYRLAPGPALDELGLEELFGVEGVVAVEWAEKLGDLRPAEPLCVEFPAGEGEERRIEFRGPAAWIDPLRRAVEESALEVSR